MASGTLLLSGLWPPFAEAVRYLLAYCDAVGIPVTVVSGFRSPEEQALLYARGRTSAQIAAHVKLHGTGGSVTDAPPGYSPHNYGLAVDLDSPQLATVRQIAQQMGFGLVSWDQPHVEWPNWQALLEG